ncbi:MAG TPA: YbaK/EbsC family protein [Spongiibacteraceae bacterium]|jgi:Ala-tRNA(Pro) deacylase|nr:YbaK/EbsC family protein [Spongiibacteraceae bacterium]HUH37294.1 YbaK/EbsC family protein [Spongiibacteraceae bacterium]
MPSQLLVDYLSRCKVPFELLQHPVAYTAPEVAEAAHIQGACFAKAVMVKIADELAMVVIPAHFHLEPALLSDAFDGRRVRLAVEREFRHRFPRCETGAMPPIGHLYGVASYMAPVFDERADIAFNAGTHTEIIRMAFADFRRLSHADMLDVGVLPPLAGPAATSAHRRAALGR